MLLYAATIFVSAFLLFLVQPIIAKQILPWFGGSAGVWSTCLVFFQLWLLAGYTYADALSRCKLKTQAVVHTLLVLLALLTLPIIADPAWKPQGNEDPGWRILALLIATIGLPYFLVATTGPLVQSWFAKAFINDPRHVKVYRLFALSNLASLLALVAYPFAVEPVIELQTQSWAWSGGFVLFALLVIATAWRTQRNTVFDASLPLPQSNTDAIPPRWTDYVLWLLLAALGTLFLLAVSTHITQNVASVPFLWIVPLSLYLLTFILCFDGSRWYRRSLFIPLLLVLTPLMAWGLQADRGVLHFEKALPLYCIGLFVVCMFCHGELAAARPAPRYLTRFYLMISVGGALGGLFVGVVAPRIFSGYWETPATLVLVSILMILVILKSIPHWRGLTLVLTLLAGGISSYYGLKYVELMRDDALLMQRNFYGTIRVKEQGTDTGNPVRHLMHGVILHGEQYQTPALRLLATTYYGPESGAGLALSLTQGPGQRIGVVGLGVGTLASYAAADSKLFLYEINPQVVEAARQFFSYLSDTPAQSETILGDARLSLEREASRQFDVLVIDAFSSDAIPVHLLTREALDIYLRHMKPNGVMAFHVTNRYLNLAPVVKQLADQAGLHSVLVSDEPEEYWLSRTDYVLVARDPKLLQQPKIAARAREITPIPGLKLWTDSYNNLFKVLK
jgi:spermidine synthase